VKRRHEQAPTAGGAPDPLRTPLPTDLYQLNMMQAYLEGGRTAPAVFELFFRKLPPRRGFLVAAGLEQGLAFRASELDWLSRSGRFSRDFVDDLAGFRFSGEVHAMPEGTVFFPDEPILRVTAPLPEAQLVETRLLNLPHFQTVIASKAARMVIAAGSSLPAATPSRSLRHCASSPRPSIAAWREVDLGHGRSGR
jgi:nicotinate phosphoribosyltransferase